MIDNELILKAKQSLDWIENNENISEIVMYPLYDLVRAARRELEEE